MAPGRSGRQVRLLAILAVLYASVVEAAFPEACPSGWLAFEGRCWYYSGYDDRRSWGQAEAFCQEQGARLISLSKESENQKLHDICRNAYVSF